MQYIRTVLGNIAEAEAGVILPHEHICCYFEYFDRMLGKEYLDKEKLAEKAVEHLLEMKEKYGLKTLVDCTPVNIGRDIELLKEISRRTGIHIVCSTGFYYTQESMLGDISEDYIVEVVQRDIELTNAGVIKYAVEDAVVSALSWKLFSALCTVQKNTGLPFVIHTNGRNQNGREVLAYALEKDVRPEAITIGHLSDSEDLEYVEEILKNGCYAGFDRIYKDLKPEYRAKKAADICYLCEKGYTERILLSHDALTFNGFHTGAEIREDNPYIFIMEYLIPELRNQGMTDQLIEQLISQNPVNMLLSR